MSAPEPRPGFFRNELDDLVAVSVPADGVSVPIGPTTRALGWIGFAGPVLLALHMWRGSVFLGIEFVARWGLARRIIELTLFSGSQLVFVAAAVGAICVLTFLAYLTEGFRVGGPRLQQILLGTSLICILAVLPPAVALFTVAVVVALYIAVVVVIASLLIALIAAMFQ